MYSDEQRYQQKFYDKCREYLGELFPNHVIADEDVLHCCARATKEYTSMVVTSFQMTPLVIAEVAISRGANISKVDSEDRTPLHIACHFRNYEMIELLVEKGADVNLLDKLNHRPLDYIIKSEYGKEQNRGDFVDLLAKSKRLELNYVMSNSDMKPLHYAASQDDADIIEALIRNGCSIHTKNRKGKTALHLASEGKKMNACKQLILLGADRDKRDNFFVPAIEGIPEQSEEGMWLTEYELKSCLAYRQFAKLNAKSAFAAILPKSIRRKVIERLELKRRMLLSFSHVFLNPELPRLLRARWEDRTQFIRRSKTSIEESEDKKMESKAEPAVLVENASKFFELMDRANFNKMAILYMMYIIFFVIFATWIVPVSTSYEQVDLVANYFTPDVNKNSEWIDYADVVEKDDVYRFLQTLVEVGLFEGDNTIGGDLILVGRPLLRQIRVRTSPCLLTKKEDACYDFYAGDKFKEAFGPLSNPTKYRYNKDHPMLQPSYEYFRDYHVSRFSLYGRGAHSILFEMDADNTSALINELKEDAWIDSSTRAVAINFGYINNNLGFATSVEYLFEFSATGRIQPTRRITSFSLTKTNDDDGASEFAYYIIVAILGLYYHLQGIYDNIEIKSRYHVSRWVAFEFVSFGTFLGVCITFAYYLLECSRIREKVAPDGEWYRGDSFIDYQSGATLFIILKSIAAVSCMLAFFKVFKYMRFTQNMNVIEKSLIMASGDLLAFTVIFSIIFVGYAFLGYFFFGSHAIDFQNFFSSLVSTFRILAGDFDYAAMSSANPIMAPVFTITYVIVIILILVNFFIAIISEHFNESTKISNETSAKERDTFSTDANYDLIEQLMSIIPSLRIPHVNSDSNMTPYNKILQGDIVIVIPASSSPQQYLDISLQLAKINVKVLMLKCTVVDESFVLNSLADSKTLHFHNKRRGRRLRLTRRSYQETLPQAIELPSKEKLELHWLAKKGLISVFESLNDSPMDVALYADIWSIHLFSYVNCTFKSFWMSRMEYHQTGDLIKEIDFRKMLNSRRLYLQFCDGFMMKKVIKVEKEKEQPKAEEADKSPETSGSDEGHAQGHIITMHEICHDIRMFLTQNNPTALKRLEVESPGEQWKKLVKEVKYAIRKLPASCLMSCSEDQLIGLYRPKVFESDLRTEDHLSLLQIVQEPVSSYLHDLFCLNMLKKGFRYSEVDDDQKKKSAMLVPYSNLDEVKKYRYRISTRAVISLIYRINYQIRYMMSNKQIAPTRIVELDHSWKSFSVKPKPGYELKIPEIGHFISESSGLQFMINTFAEEMHSEWAKARLAEGYVYFDDKVNPGNPVPAKWSPRLKHYFLLTQQEKETYRSTARNVISFLIYLGYVIVRKNEKGILEEISSDNVERSNLNEGKAEV